MAPLNAPTPEPENSSDMSGAAREPFNPGAPLRAGTQLGQYVIERVIGGGGYGIVYAARHTSLAEAVAIKVLRAELAISPVLVTRFMREAQAVNRIGHPNIVSIREFADSEHGRPYFVMELLEGVDLQAYLAAHGRFSAHEALELLAPVCEAIAAAHAVGIIHRDIKASNVMISERAGKRSVKLLDFGIAKILSPELAGPGLTEPGVRLGTAGNMAPEQIRAEPIDERADIYALGVLLFELLTGEPPFRGIYPQQVALLHLQAPAPRPSTLAPVSPELDAVVLRCLEKLPDRRFQSVSALLDAFQQAVGDDSAARASASPAVAFYCEASARSEDAELEDAWLDDLLAVLELVEQTLRQQEFSLPMRTSNALLAVRLIDSGTSEESARSQALAIGRELCSRLERRASAHPGLVLALSMTVGVAHSQSAAAGCEILGGPLFELNDWTAQNRIL
ncbi:MAG: serine/threonine protein kinase [Myxococcaceae bacterium]|nr:serine/threonine protein kinase [Myxococcaceae bacterium]